MLEMFVLNEVNCLAGERVSYKRWSYSNGLLFCRRTVSLSLSATFMAVLHVLSKTSAERDMWYTRRAFKNIEFHPPSWLRLQKYMPKYIFHLNLVDCKKFQCVSKKRCKQSSNLTNNFPFIVCQSSDSLLGREMVHDDRLSSTWSAETPKGRFGFTRQRWSCVDKRVENLPIDGKGVVEGISMIVDCEKNYVLINYSQLLAGWLKNNKNAKETAMRNYKLDGSAKSVFVSRARTNTAFNHIASLAATKPHQHVNSRMKDCARHGKSLSCNKN